MLALICAFIFTTFAHSQEAVDISGAAQHWAREGSVVVRSCDGEEYGMGLKLLTEVNQVIAARGVIICTDLRTSETPEDSYLFEVDFLAIDPTTRLFNMTRTDSVTVNFFGLAIYEAQVGNSGVTWLFEDVVPIDLVLERNNDGSSFAFTGVSFTVPVSALERANRMAFYLTLGGAMIQMGFI
jgi:hypothetical protein